MGSRLRRREAPSWNPNHHASNDQNQGTKRFVGWLRLSALKDCGLSFGLCLLVDDGGPTDPPKHWHPSVETSYVFDSLVVRRHFHLEQGAWIEIERCVGCQHHQYCTSHSEAPAEGMGRCWQHLTIFDEFQFDVDWWCRFLKSFLKPLRLCCGHCGHCEDRRSTTNTNASWPQPSAKSRITRGPKHGLIRWRLRWVTIQKH